MSEKGIIQSFSQQVLKSKGQTPIKVQVPEKPKIKESPSRQENPFMKFMPQTLMNQEGQSRNSLSIQSTVKKKLVKKVVTPKRKKKSEGSFFPQKKSEQVEELLELVYKHIQRCPGLRTDIAKSGGSRLLDSYMKKFK